LFRPSIHEEGLAKRYIFSIQGEANMETKGLRLSLFAMSVLLGGACLALTPFLNGAAAEVKAVADDSTTYTDTSVSQVMFQNGNALLQIYLTTSDWASAGSTAFPGTTLVFSFDFMSKIKIYTDDTTSYTMADLHASGSQVYYNMWGVYGQGSLAVQLSQTGDAVKKSRDSLGNPFPLGCYDGVRSLYQWDSSLYRWGREYGLRHHFGDDVLSKHRDDRAAALLSKPPSIPRFSDEHPLQHRRVGQIPLALFRSLGLGERSSQYGDVDFDEQLKFLQQSPDR
jgi:hypothetical protein